MLRMFESLLQEQKENCQKVQIDIQTCLSLCGIWLFISFKQCDNFRIAEKEASNNSHLRHHCNKDAIAIVQFRQEFTCSRTLKHALRNT